LIRLSLSLPLLSYSNKVFLLPFIWLPQKRQLYTPNRRLYTSARNPYGRWVSFVSVCTRFTFLFSLLSVCVTARTDVSTSAREIVVQWWPKLAHRAGFRYRSDLKKKKKKVSNLLFRIAYSGIYRQNKTRGPNKKKTGIWSNKTTCTLATTSE
jgi:hypothetical protein